MEGVGVSRGWEGYHESERLGLGADLVVCVGGVVDGAALAQQERAHQ